MEPAKDTVGQEIWAAFQGKESYEVIERDDGFVGLSGGAKSYLSPYGQWPAWQKRAIRFAGGRTLDIGCGAGRVGLHLRQRGLRVTSIDSSPLAVRVCRKRGVPAHVMPIERVGEFKDSSFDTVVMLGNNFSLFGGFRKARRLLKTLHRITSADAIIIAESSDPYKTGDPVHLAYHRRNGRRGRMAGQIRMKVRFRNYATGWFDFLLVSREEMERILDGTGWVVRECVDSGESTYVAIIEKASSLAQRRKRT